ncbi:twin-arginine translocase TatA/TatE family subunit [Qipengyuania flava]|uniref:twin-arginine translocase TatA/TatE family subunit n=1 Tax=Qipengyuania TaxID=1855416 RepID=UPI001C870751|nr:twin-arginine translocase TatA/TatE family subunit [Qipengyuania aestuarii]MBX7535593.1 twin-arginine translocase TatA/TatE family subunit [Qipengyuania aestuarii]MCA0978118.1 twin-arginine translocase TatA/TatE family subunit [Qipengyuania flava]
MSLGPWQLVIIAILILVLFGRGRISEMMGDFGKGIKSFKQGMNEEEAKPAKRISHEAKPADEGLTEDQVKQPSETK